MHGARSSSSSLTVSVFDKRAANASAEIRAVAGDDTLLLMMMLSGGCWLRTEHNRSANDQQTAPPELFYRVSAKRDDVLRWMEVCARGISIYWWWLLFEPGG